MGSSGINILKNLLLWAEDEDDERVGEEACTFDHEEWTLIQGDKEMTPQQGNGSDCGVFMLAFAAHLMEDLPLPFNQDDINQFRNHIALALEKNGA
eukprot:g10921.t1